MRATFSDDPAMISPDRASTHTRPQLLSNTIERRRHALADVKSVDRTDRAHRPASAERREGANEYNSHASAPGRDPTARARPKHTENRSALSGGTP
jgi:hypothetical protein